MSPKERERCTLRGGGKPGEHVVDVPAGSGDVGGGCGVVATVLVALEDDLSPELVSDLRREEQ